MSALPGRLRLGLREFVTRRLARRVREGSLAPGYGVREQFLLARYPALLNENGGFLLRIGDEEWLYPLATHARDVTEVRVASGEPRRHVIPDAVRDLAAQSLVEDGGVVPYRAYDRGVHNGPALAVSDCTVDRENESVVLDAAPSDYFSVATTRAMGAEIHTAAVRNGLRLDGDPPTPLRDAQADDLAALAGTDCADAGALVALVLNRADGCHELRLARRSTTTLVERGRWSTRVSGGVEQSDDGSVRGTVVRETVEELLGGDADSTTDEAADRRRVETALDEGRAHFRELGVQLNTAFGVWQLPTLLYAEDEEFAEWLAARDERGDEHDAVRRCLLPLDGVPRELTPGLASQGAVGTVGLALRALEAEFGVETGVTAARPVRSRAEAVDALDGRVPLDRSGDDARVRYPGRVGGDDPVLRAVGPLLARR